MDIINLNCGENKKFTFAIPVGNKNNRVQHKTDNFLLQALLESTGTHLAFSNGWRYGAPIVPGNITLNDLYNIIPMNPTVSTVYLSGQEITKMLEKNIERTFS